MAFDIPEESQRQLWRMSWQTSCEQVKSHAFAMCSRDPHAADLAAEVVRDFLNRPVPTTAAEMSDGLLAATAASEWVNRCAETARQCLRDPESAEQVFAELRTLYRECRDGSSPS
jgi:hypothetical protein